MSEIDELLDKLVIAVRQDEQASSKYSRQAIYHKRMEIQARLAAAEARVAELEAQVAALCPIGDLSGLPAWQAEKAYLQERIAELEAANAWIPVSERLPEVEKGWFLVYGILNWETGEMAVRRGLYDGRDKKFRSTLEVITHWQPEPKGPESEARDE